MHNKNKATTERQLDDQEATLTFLVETRAGKYAKVTESSLLYARLTAAAEEDPQEEAHCFGYR